MLAEQFERISRVSCVTPLAQQQAKPLHSLHDAAPTAKEAPCPQHGVITLEISNPFLFVIVNLKIFCLFSPGNSPSRSLGSGVSLLAVQERGPSDPQRAGCGEGTTFADPLSPPPRSLHLLSHAEMLSDGCGCLSLLPRQHEKPAQTGVQLEHHAVGNHAEIGAGTVGHTPGLPAQRCVGPATSLLRPIPSYGPYGCHPTACRQRSSLLAGALVHK